jgi:hypothetical protein
MFAIKIIFKIYDFLSEKKLYFFIPLKKKVGVSTKIIIFIKNYFSNLKKFHIALLNSSKNAIIIVNIAGCILIYLTMFGLIVRAQEILKNKFITIAV